MPSSNVPWGPALTRLNPWFPGQMGVPGTDADTGLRLDSNGIILYVDPNHVDNDDQRDGTNPTAPLTTVAEALTQCRAYRNDTIIVAPNSNWLHGDVRVGRATAIAEEVTVTVPGVRIIGLAPSGSLGVYWNPLTTSGVCITAHAIDVLIEGFCFWTNAVVTPVAILSEWDGVTKWGDNLTVRNCFFESGLDYGIQLDFCYYCDIHHNHFELCDTAAIHNLAAEGNPDFSNFHHNNFYNNAVALSLDGCTGTFIYDNRIMGAPAGTDNFIALAGGATNTVTNNWLACTIAQYDATCDGGGAGNAWINNHCIDGDPLAIPAG